MLSCILYPVLESPLLVYTLIILLIGGAIVVLCCLRSVLLLFCDLTIAILHYYCFKLFHVVLKFGKDQ